MLDARRWLLERPTLARAGVSLAEYPTNSEAVRAMVTEMRNAARAGCVDPLVRAFAIRAVRACGAVAQLCQARALLAETRRALAYVPDPNRADQIAPARWTLVAGGGDCDDLSAFLAAAACSIGLPAAFVIGSARASTPTHVLVALGVDGQWRWADPSSDDLPLGNPGPGFRGMRWFKV